MDSMTLMDSIHIPFCTQSRKYPPHTAGHRSSTSSCSQQFSISKNHGHIHLGLRNHSQNYPQNHPQKAHIPPLDSQIRELEEGHLQPDIPPPKSPRQNNIIADTETTSHLLPQESHSQNTSNKSSNKSTTDTVCNRLFNNIKKWKFSKQSSTGKQLSTGKQTSNLAGGKILSATLFPSTQYLLHGTIVTLTFAVLIGSILSHAWVKLCFLKWCPFSENGMGLSVCLLCGYVGWHAGRIQQRNWIVPWLNISGASACIFLYLISIEATAFHSKVTQVGCILSFSIYLALYKHISSRHGPDGQEKMTIFVNSFHLFLSLALCVMIATIPHARQLIGIWALVGWSAALHAAPV
jgi:hypothetical protein